MTEEQEIQQEEEVMNISDILDKLPVSILHDICDRNHIKETRTKKHCIQSIIQSSIQKGIKEYFFNEISKEDIRLCLEQLKKETIEHNNKSKMLEELKKEIKKEKDLFSFLLKLNLKTLIEFTSSLGFKFLKEEEELKKEEIIELLKEEILIFGLTQTFNIILSESILKILKYLNLKNLKNKLNNIKNILSLNYPHLKNELNEQEEEKEEKKEIKKVEFKKGITFQDLYDSYYTNELSDYCLKNGLKKSGSKKELIKRILNYLNFDIKEEVKSKKRKNESKEENNLKKKKK
eukprot:gene194-4440_t